MSYVVKIRYTFTLYSAIEMKKPKGQRIGKASSIDLLSDMPWIDFHEELKMQAGKLYSKPILDDMHNFKINYTIPRISANPLSLDTKNDYEYMIENVNNSKKKDMTIKVQICELPVSDQFTSCVPLPISNTNLLRFRPGRKI